MSFGIVVPLKSKMISKDWDVTSESLKNTVSSVLNQTDRNFKLYIAGHEKPDFLEDCLDDRIDFHKVGFEPPNKADPNYSPQDLINDKRLKILSALKKSENNGHDYYFQLDSDDLIRFDFIESVKKYFSSGNTQALVLKGGYLYYKDCDRLVPTNELDVLCGSCVVARSNSFGIPSEVSLSLIEDVPWTKFEHVNIHKFFRGNGGDVSYSNACLVAYVLASGDNFSDRWRVSLLSKFKWKLKPYILGRKAGEKFFSDFAIR